MKRKRFVVIAVMICVLISLLIALNSRKCHSHNKDRSIVTNSQRRQRRQRRLATQGAPQLRPEPCEIPVGFREKARRYLRGVYDRVSKQGDHQLINGIATPHGLRTDHMRERIGSERHVDTMAELFFILHLFHQYAEKHGILYSIGSGNLLGHLSGSDVLPWDDDMDVMVATRSLPKIRELWEGGKRERKVWDRNWKCREVALGSFNVFILRRREDDFFKLRLSMAGAEVRGAQQEDIGGLDLEGIEGISKGGQSRPLSRELVDKILDHETEADYPPGQYGPIQARILRKELAVPLISAMYPRWREKAHPEVMSRKER